MSNKKTCAARIGIFLVFAYLIYWIPIWVLDRIPSDSDQPHITLIFLISGYAPAIASILTRIFTKEGFSDNFLHFRFLRGKGKYYVLTPLLMLALIAIPALLQRIVLSSRIEQIDFLADSSAIELTTSCINACSSAILCALFMIGIELGWRGYLMPRLEHLIGTLPAILLGGILVGVSSIPLLQYDWLYGRDASMFLRILVLFGHSIALNALFTWAAKRSGTIYPACIAAGLSETGCVLFQQLLLGGHFAEKDLLSAAAIALIPELIIAAFLSYQCIKQPAYDTP